MTLPHDVAVLVIAYKRYETTLQVLKSLRAVRPRRVFFAVNAPNPKHQEEESCRMVRESIREIDWPCDVTPWFRTEHLSAKDSISSAITWFFDNVEEGIILEDDCVVSPTFFPFAQELLDRYRANPQVMHIAACNFRGDGTSDRESYYFSNICYIWGWATWRRAWKAFNDDATRGSRDRFIEVVNARFRTKAERSYWLCMYDYVQSGNLDTWDFQWTFSVWAQQGLAITPQRNLVTNVGFGADGTNNLNDQSQFSNLSATDLEFPIKHPSNTNVDDEADRFDAVHVRRIPDSYRLWHLKLRLAKYLPATLKRRVKKAMQM